MKKLNDVLEKEVVKKTVYDELVKKVNANQTNDTSNLVRKTDYEIYSITQKFNKLMEDLGSKNDIADFVKKERF